MESGDDLVQYYAARATEYERIYHRNDPIRQAEQAGVVEALKSTLRGRSVVEVACGTGYWTEFLAAVAESVLATDLTPQVLGLARTKPMDPKRVRFQVASAFDLFAIEGNFNGALAAFWLSHVPRVRLGEFLGHLHERLLPGSAVFMVDNVLVPGVGGQLASSPDCQDTFKRRVLDDGSEHLVLKNYFSRTELSGLFRDGEDLRICVGRCFWWVSYRTKNEE
jgi:SAM-dependent methyltransferase